MEASQDRENLRRGLSVVGTSDNEKFSVFLDGNSIITKTFMEIESY